MAVATGSAGVLREEEEEEDCDITQDAHPPHLEVFNSEIGTRFEVDFSDMRRLFAQAGENRASLLVSGPSTKESLKPHLFLSEETRSTSPVREYNGAVDVFFTLDAPARSCSPTIVESQYVHVVTGLEAGNKHKTYLENNFPPGAVWMENEIPNPNGYCQNTRAFTAQVLDTVTRRLTDTKVMRLPTRGRLLHMDDGGRRARRQSTTRAVSTQSQLLDKTRSTMSPTASALRGLERSFSRSLAFPRSTRHAASAPNVLAHGNLPPVLDPPVCHVVDSPRTVTLMPHGKRGLPPILGYQKMKMPETNRSISLSVSLSSHRSHHTQGLRTQRNGSIILSHR